MCTWRPNNEIETSRSDQGRQYLYFLDRQFCEELTGERKQLWEVQLVRNSKQNLGCGSQLVKSNKGFLHSLLGCKFPIFR